MKESTKFPIDMRDDWRESYSVYVLPHTGAAPDRCSEAAGRMGAEVAACTSSICQNRMFVAA